MVIFQSLKAVKICFGLIENMFIVMIAACVTVQPFSVMESGGRKEAGELRHGIVYLKARHNNLTACSVQESRCCNFYLLPMPTAHRHLHSTKHLPVPFLLPGNRQ